MAETNRNRDTRMDRTEKALELLIADHEQFRHDHKQLLTAQVLARILQQAGITRDQWDQTA